MPTPSTINITCNVVVDDPQPVADALYNTMADYANHIDIQIVQNVTVTEPQVVATSGSGKIGP